MLDFIMLDFMSYSELHEIGFSTRSILTYVAQNELNLNIYIHELILSDCQLLIDS